MNILTNVILPLMILATPFVVAFILLNKYQPGNLTYKVAVALALITAFILVWVNLAVGIIGSEDNNANLMFLCLLILGLIGAFKSRFQPMPMSYVMLLMVILHVLIATIELIFQFGSHAPIWPWDILKATLLFVILWFVAALLFRKAAQVQNSIKNMHI